MPESPHERAAIVKTYARELGFELVGIARAEGSAYGAAFRAWLAAGKEGEMAYLGRHLEERLDVRRKLPWARSVVCVGLAYWQKSVVSGQWSVASGDKVDEAQRVGKIARYAWGRDYHKVVEGKLKKLETRVRGALGGEKIEIRAYVDAGPVLERELAARAGLGWVGKNTLLIDPRHGSWFVLGELVTSLELEPDSPIADHCGTCTRCIEACPTRAITPYSMEARVCISYLTLEHRAAIPETLEGPMRNAGYLIGCDICQEVCPFNSEGRPWVTREADFAARPPAPAVPLAEVLAWQEQEWDILTRGRAGRRAKFEMWKRNARVLGGIENGK
jgi:epoxyqueuosine reductase